MDADARLEKIRQDLDDGDVPEAPTVREFLSWFGAKRRGASIVASIRESLRDAGLVTNPDFQGAYIEDELQFVRTPAAGSSGSKTGQAAPDPIGENDPTFRIGKLPSANKGVTRVSPNQSIAAACTTMLSKDFSQLPVMTDERTVKGIISWETIGQRLALQQVCTEANDCKEPHQEVSADDSLFAVIDRIVKHQYVLVRGPKGKISGIVTTSDVSEQFRQLGEPFLLIGEIENHLRNLLAEKFSTKELQAIVDPDDVRRTVQRPSDLTFGEYRRLLELPERWDKLGLPLDRKVFIARLDEVRRVRNDVMHFDPDGIPDEDLDNLRDFAAFLRRLAAIGAI